MASQPRVRSTEEFANSLQETWDNDRSRQKAQVFKYELPSFEKGLGAVRLTKSDILSALVQVHKGRGEIQLHAHTAEEGFWWVVGGRVRFYGEHGPIAELGTNEGIHIPRGFKYRFETSSDAPLELLHVAAYVHKVADKRIDYTKMADDQVIYDFDGRM